MIDAIHKSPIKATSPPAIKAAVLTSSAFVGAVKIPERDKKFV